MGTFFLDIFRHENDNRRFLLNFLKVYFCCGFRLYVSSRAEILQNSSLLFNSKSNVHMDLMQPANYRCSCYHPATFTTNSFCQLQKHYRTIKLRLQKLNS